MLKKLFPFVMQLHMLQLEEYKITRFLSWIYLNFFKRYSTSKKKLVWTFKSRFILAFSLIYAFLFTVAFLYILGPLGLLFSVILWTQPYLLLILGLITLKPYEIYNRYRTKKSTLSKITDLKSRGLKVIAVAGSYGKTSVKEFLYSLLKTKFKVLRTPESYNTLFGVAKVVDLELDSKYDFFICEMGAYTQGEIKEICIMVDPNHAILCGINEQHLDRFKKIENTIMAKFEVIKYSSNNGYKVINGANKNILDNYSRYIEKPILYGKVESGFYTKDLEFTTAGSKFTLVLQNIPYKVTTPLVGSSNIENILAASAMAYMLGVDESFIINAIKNLKPVAHRLEIKTWNNGLHIIDDAYSSNVTGFKAALELLDSFKSSEKVLVTPGVVELGIQNHSIHVDLGKLSNQVCNKILLVGKNERTAALYEGVKDKEKVKFIQSLEELPLHIEHPDSSIVLIENDLPDNY